MKLVLALAAVAGGIAFARSRSGSTAADPWHQATAPVPSPDATAPDVTAPDITAPAPSASPDTPAGSARSENGTTPSGT